MVSETIEAPAETQADPAQLPLETETESPAPVEGVEAAAPEAEDAAAAVPQVEVTEEAPKPEYLTVEQWEKEKAEVAQRAAAEAIEADRRKRQTENARKAQQEERAKQRLSQTVDAVKATLVARGYDPEVATDESVITAIDRVAQERADSLTKERADTVGDAWDYLTAPAYGQSVDLDDSFAEVARTLSPKLQNFIDTIRPQIEAKAREGYISEADLPAKVDAEIAKRAAKSRVGETDLARPQGAPSGAETGSPAWWSSIGAEGRKDPVNQAKFDAWIAAHQ